LNILTTPPALEDASVVQGAAHGRRRKISAHLLQVPAPRLMMVIIIKRPEALWADVLDVYRGIWPAHGKMCKHQADTMQAICTRGQESGMANALTPHIRTVNSDLRLKQGDLKDNLRPCVSGQIHPVLCVGLKQRMEHSTQAHSEALQVLFLCDLLLLLQIFGHVCLGVQPIIEPLQQLLPVGQRDEAVEAEAQPARDTCPLAHSRKRSAR
jgi:hypothetical protein